MLPVDAQKSWVVNNSRMHLEAVELELGGFSLGLFLVDKMHHFQTTRPTSRQIKLARYGGYPPNSMSFYNGRLPIAIRPNATHRVLIQPGN